MHTLPTAG
jgi:hypothetical protein